MDKKELIIWLKEKLLQAEDNLSKCNDEDDELSAEFFAGRADALNEVLEKIGYYTTVSYLQTIDK